MNVKKCLVSAVILAFSSFSHATFIDFNDGTSGAAMDSFYSGLGVTFSNAKWDNFVSPNEGSVGAGGLKLVSIIDTYSNKSDNPIVIDFDSAVSSFSIYGLNVGENGALLSAFDINGTLIDTVSVFGVDAGVENHPLLESTVSGIYSVELSQAAVTANEGMLWDNLSFTPMVDEPTPASTPSIFALLGLSIVGLFAAQQKNRKR